MPNARAVAGLSRDRRWLILFTVDRAPGGGMRVGEAADLLIRDYNAWDALNLDGGGSATLAMADPAPRIVNVPSGSPAGQAVGSNLAVWGPLPPIGRGEAMPCGWLQLTCTTLSG